MFRERPHIDGSFLAGVRDYLPEEKPRAIVTLDWQQDPAMEGKLLEFVSVMSKDAIWSLLAQGKTYAKVMDKRGDFETLEMARNRNI
jgi:hypothetical protein